MPQYITSQSIVDLYGSDYLVVSADRDDDDSVDTTAVDRAIRDAEALVNSYLSQVYDLPLAGIVSTVDPSLNTVPDVLISPCIDIAIYKLSAQPGYSLTKEKRKRYEDAIDWLIMVAGGKTGIGLDEPPVTVGQGVWYETMPREFTRKKLTGLY